jgi:hypothetical protein
MNILQELIALLTGLGVSVETGVFSDTAPDEYVVITPLTDTFGLYGDNRPECETQEARLSLYRKGTYLVLKNKIVKALLNADYTITERQYIEHEDDTGYHHYAIDTAKLYEWED